MNCALIVISHVIPRGRVIIGVSVPGSLTKPLPYMVGGTLHRGGTLYGKLLSGNK